MTAMPRGSDSSQTVIRVSPIAHFASAFLTMALLTIGPAFGKAGLVLLVIPVLVSVAVERLRTVADDDTVTARTLFSSRTVRWPQIEGLKFTRGRWARACLTDGSDMLLPAVTFVTLPRLTAASGGRVPNPYRR
ncbi:MAG: PH domain-containing protein [Mycobacterium sp.]|nr:PH domain-containing protein [Mycobacterium sp.]